MTVMCLVSPLPPSCSEICGELPQGVSRPAAEGCETSGESQSGTKLPPTGGRPVSKPPAPPRGEEKPGSEPPKHPNAPYKAMPTSNQQPPGITQPHPAHSTSPSLSGSSASSNLHHRRSSETMATFASYHRVQSVPASPNLGHLPAFVCRSQSTHSLQEGGGALRSTPSGSSLLSASSSMTNLQEYPSTTSLQSHPNTTNSQGAPNLPRQPSAASLPRPPSTGNLQRAPGLQKAPSSTSLQGNIHAVPSSPPSAMHKAPHKANAHAVMVTVPAHPPSVSFPPPTEPQLRSRRSTDTRTSVPVPNTRMSTQAVNASARTPIELQYSQTYTQPLISTHTDPSPGRQPRSRPGHSDNSSLTSVCRPSHSRNSSYGNISLGNLSLMSNVSSVSGSAISLNSTFVFDKSTSQPPPSQAEGTNFDKTAAQPQSDQTEGYNFARYFNLFSPFTSNMALQYNCVQRTDDSPPECSAPPIWCMSCWNQVIAVGCGNGQLEVGVVWITCL